MGNIDIKESPHSPKTADNRPQLTKALDSIYSDRSFSEYLDILGISKKDLGSRVLDLGSGRRENFSREAGKLGIEVVSLNPKLIDEEYVSEARSEMPDYPHQARSVLAIATHLPFADNSFDSVVSVYGIPLYLQAEDYEKSLLEIIRVLKSKKKAYLGPIPKYTEEDSYSPLRNVLIKLDKNNFSYSFRGNPWASKRLVLTKK